MIYKGLKRIVVVAGGPSAARWMNALGVSEIPWIGINHSVKEGPDVAFSQDLGFLKNEAVGNPSWFRNWNSVKFRVFQFNREPPAPVAAIRRPIWFAQGIPEWSDVFDNLAWGESSGVGALNLATLLAEEVYLLGYDMRGKYERWHGEGRKMPDQMLETYRRDLDEKWAPHAKRAARIVNLNLDSGVRSFEFMEPEKFFRDAA